MWMDILKISIGVLSKELRNDIKQSGGRIYQIGGAVRDEFLGKVSKDLDLIITGIDIDDLQKLLGEYGSINLVGRNYGVLKFRPEGMEGEPIDISVPRVEVSTGEGHKDFEVRLGKDITLEQEQLRRDFWMNAIAKDIETGELVDIEGKGQLDIKNRQISVINPKAFDDDPLRMLRAVQFAARFDFEIEKETMKEIKKNADKIMTVSHDRFQEEFRKMFEKAEKPTIGIDLLIETGMMKHILEKGQSNPLMDDLNKDAFPVFVALLAESYGNDAGKVVQNLMKLSNRDVLAVQGVVDYQTISPTNDLEVVNFIRKRKEKEHIIANIDSLMESKGKELLSDRLKTIKTKGKPTSIKELAVNGEDLMQEGFSGTEIGQALEFLLELAVKSGKNEKGHLIRKVKSQFNKGDNWKKMLMVRV